MKDIREDQWSDAILDLTHDVARFCDRHGASLCDVLERAGGAEGVDALCDLHEELSKRHPGPSRIAETAHRILAVLENATAVPADVMPALRWHGAKLTDLIGKNRK